MQNIQKYNKTHFEIFAVGVSFLCNTLIHKPLERRTKKAYVVITCLYRKSEKNPNMCYKVSNNPQVITTLEYILPYYSNFWHFYHKMLHRCDVSGSR